jgi:phosphatidylethanolamine-binding protein (PEBP) family uncharacterized protein
VWQSAAVNTRFLPIFLLVLLGALSLGARLSGHDLADGAEHPHYDWSVKPPGADGTPIWFLAQADASPRPRALVTPANPAVNEPVQAGVFKLFAPNVRVRWDARFLFVESNGLPTHNMMVGITAWQQQVPLPQNYTGANAWQIPLSPVPSKLPVSIKGRFLRGAIALAVNGIPIFNPQNNRGEVSAEIGELDQWGGHCGRADDYHYHAAPLHLQSVVGKDKPIAYALDGYPIYGLTEPDGTPPAGLDAFNGHTTPGLGYHYHASTKYPYVNGGFHGEVVEAGGQVDPQPSAQPARPAGAPLRGAKITAFETTGNTSRLTYEVNGEKRSIVYAVNTDGTLPFEFQNGSAGTTKETYTRRQRGGPGGNPPPGDGPRPPRPGAGPGDRAGNQPQDTRPAPPANPSSSASTAPPDSSSKPLASFVLSSPVVANGGNLPVEFTGDGAGITPPLEWKGAPAGTKSYTLVMHHLDPEGKTKWYWILYNIPPNVQSLPKNVQGIGTVGTGFKGQVGYEPPHSRGPGAKTYVLSLYALSAPADVTVPPSQVNYDGIMAALKGRILASADLSVVYTSKSSGSGDAPPGGPGRRRNPDGQNPPPDGRPGPGNGAPGNPPPSAPPSADNGAPSQAAGAAPRGQGGGNPGKPDQKGLIKPTLADTVHVNVYADNWFAMFINGELVAVDSIKFTPHNVMSFDILPEYPMTIAVLAKDNADPKTGLEYGDHIGDGGFIAKFSDGTVTNATWKAKNFFKGPLNRDTKNPKVEHTPIPDKWWTTDFDDSSWPNATEFTEERVGPKEHFYKFDFSGAKFIWSDDLDLDNTIIFRTRIEKPGWKPRWNTHPDLDISGAPFK